ncbi:MAG: ATPase, T2SS/T4P/T4SS family [Capsulimonadaceae bacterium]|nr:ATPase, T2SS/T4P/T4SS family [Capsulimonadaceae bacterium]
MVVAQADHDDDDELGLLTIDEAAKFLGTSKSTLYRLLGQGDLSATKVGKQWRFRKSDLRAYLNRDASPAEPEITDIDEEKMRMLLDDEPIVQLGYNIVLQAIREKASDIHIEANKNGVRVRFRIDGVLQDILSVPKEVQGPLIARFKVLADLNLSERRIPQDGRIPLRHEGIEYDLRVNCLPTNFGESLSMRLLNRSSVLLKLDKLGFAPEELASIQHLFNKPSGMILASGPAESGKTMFLYACLNELNKPDVKIVTIEDPVEYIIPGLLQVHVQQRAGMTFQAALRAFMRQDADVIMVSDTRDEEVAHLAIEAAVAGRVVLGAMYAESAPATLFRLTDMGMEAYLVAAAVSGIVNLRMARRLCVHCKRAVDPAEASRLLRKVMSVSAAGGYSINVVPALYEAVGCDECHGLGFQGRLPLHEVLVCNPQLAKQMLQCRDASEAIRLAVESGMRTLVADGVSKAVAGETTVDEVLRVTLGPL